jgi:hypothetical protein
MKRSCLQQRIANSESHAALPNRAALDFHSAQFGNDFSSPTLFLCATKRARYRKYGSAVLAPVIQRALFRITIPIQISTFRDFGNFLRFGPNDAFALSMRHLPWLEYKPRTDYRILSRTSRENTPGLSSWRLTPGCPARFKPFHRWWTV